MADRGDKPKSEAAGGASAAPRTRSTAAGATGRGRVAKRRAEDAEKEAPPVDAEVPQVQELERVGRYRIGAVASATGIAAHTLRVWERRYGAFSTQRTEGGTRLYSDADVQRARVLAKLQRQGHAIGDIAGLHDAELATLLAAGGLEGPTIPLATSPSDLPQIGEAFLESVRVFDLPRAERTLRTAIAGTEPRTLVLELLPQLFEEIGRRWETGAYEIAHEHAASALLRDALGELLHAWRPVASVGSVVAVTLSGELHEFGALLAAMLASVCGWRPVYLGPNLPPEEIVLAAGRVDARAVLVSVVCAQGSRACRDFAGQLRQIRAELPDSCELLVGGAAAPLLELAEPGVKVVGDLRSLERWMLGGRR